jgi:hypothetical protein
MRATLAIAFLAACGTSRDEPPPPQPPVAVPADANPPAFPHQVHATAAAALESIIARARPRVLGVGEVHLVAGGPAVRSALSRFTDDMLGVLEGHATDVVVETWVADGRCGAVEKTVTADVRATTERPPEMENEITRLLRRAGELRMRPHVLRMRCDHYQEIRASSGEVDYDKLLTLIGRELLGNVKRVLAGKKDAAVIVYGGALHNDRAPNEGVAAYSYGVVLAAEHGPGYVELDLYVPELIAGDAVLAAEPWFPLVASAGDKVLLIERGASSYIILLPRGVAR